MPARNRDKRVEEEANHFCTTKSFYPIHCKHFKPTLEELQSTTFSDYVRNTVLSQCQVDYSDAEEEAAGVVNGGHGSRIAPNNENSKRYCAKTPKISFDYGTFPLLCF